jgi:hypothetical protein
LSGLFILGFIKAGRSSVLLCLLWSRVIPVNDRTGNGVNSIFSSAKEPLPLRLFIEQVVPFS